LECGSLLPLLRARRGTLITTSNGIVRALPVDIAPHNGVEPNAALIAHLHVSDNGGIGCDKTIVPKDG